MSNQSKPALASSKPSEEQIRDYAYHLYLQGSREPGHDIEHWFEARACLKAKISADHSHSRLHLHLQNPPADRFSLLAAEARILAS